MTISRVCEDRDKISVVSLHSKDNVACFTEES